MLPQPQQGRLGGVRMRARLCPQRFLFSLWILNQAFPLAPPVNTPQYQANEEHLLTVCCHANIDAFLKATFLALVASDFVYDAFSFIFAGIRWMKTFLNGSSKETLNKKDPKRTRFIFFETMTTLEFYVYLKWDQLFWPLAWPGASNFICTLKQRKVDASESRELREIFQVYSVYTVVAFTQGDEADGCLLLCFYTLSGITFISWGVIIMQQS